MTTLTPLAEARAKSNPNGWGSQGSMPPQYLRLVMCVWPSTTTGGAPALTGPARHGRLGIGLAELQHGDLDVAAALSLACSNSSASGTGSRNTSWLVAGMWHAPERSARS